MQTLQSGHCAAAAHTDCRPPAHHVQTEKRYNYTTPKTFLELIKLYKSVLARKREQVQNSIDRLDTGGVEPPMAAWQCRVWLLLKRIVARSPGSMHWRQAVSHTASS